MSTNTTHTPHIFSPDDQFVAWSGPENTMILLRAAPRIVHGCYFGHQDGVYGRRSDQNFVEREHALRKYAPER